MCDRSQLNRLSLTDAVAKIANECDRRGMRPPYTFRFTDLNGKELEVVQIDDLDDIGETKSRGEGSFKTAIRVTVTDRDGRVLVGATEASKAKSAHERGRS
jgi:hypothetical protein